MFRLFTLVILRYSGWSSCTSFLCLRKLGHNTISSDAALPRPNDQGAAPIDPKNCSLQIPTYNFRGAPEEFIHLKKL
jgi:hypothetical protein